MTTEFDDQSSEAGGVQSDPVGDAHGVDSGQPEPSPPVSEGSDAGPSAEMISVLAGVEIPENLQEHWDEDAASTLYSEALAAGIEPETISKLMNSYAKGQSERLPQAIETAQEQAQERLDEAAEARAANARRELQDEWRSEYEAKVGNARKAAANLWSQGELEQLTQIRLSDGSLLGDNPTLIKALVKASGKMALESTAELAHQEIAALEEDADFQKHYHDASDDPAHRAAVAKHTRLFERAYPESAPTEVKPVTAEEQAAAKEQLKAYSENKALGEELAKAMSNLDSPGERSDKDRQILAHWKELNRIASAPIASGGGTFAGKPIGASGPQMSRAEALAEIAKIEKAPGLWDPDVPTNDLAAHRALIARRDALL